MELLPLLIFLGGIVYTAIASQKDKGKKEKRNIDPGKLGNPSKSNKQESEKGFFEQMKKEIERSFGTPDDSPYEQRKQQTQTSSQTPEGSSQQRPSYQRAERTSPTRPVADRSFGKSLEEKARDSKTGRKAMDYYEDRVEMGSSKYRERAESTGRKTAERTSHSFDDDLSKTYGASPKVKKEKQGPILDKGDFSFDRKAVLNGIIFSEILGKPKSKR